MNEAETKEWWKLFEEYGISDANWSIFDKDETASALKSGASERGAWTDAELTASGKLIRAELRKWADEQSCASDGALTSDACECGGLTDTDLGVVSGKLLRVESELRK